MGPHGRGGSCLERERDDLVVERREHGLVVALDDHQLRHDALHQEFLVVQ